jgi:hypothetical protein
MMAVYLLCSVQHTDIPCGKTERLFQALVHLLNTTLLNTQLRGSFTVDFFIICQQVIRDFLCTQPRPLPITLLLFQQSTCSPSRRSGRLIAIRTPHSNSVRSIVCRLLFPSTNPVIQPSGDISITFGLQSRFIDSPRHYRRNSSHHLEACQNFIPS